MTGLGRKMPGNVVCLCQSIKPSIKQWVICRQVTPPHRDLSTWETMITTPPHHLPSLPTPTTALPINRKM
ncbi:hypothetical protein E2C01_004268 [Portunus trituberculatus]|uniref:Uncharacterized protein n=1 Tax=Portunus trituberculatus TaxID=210409 RepID=A0A5B7CR68_PORTR|nr:hypothetical protein [Portunus trituberculatus]